MEAIGSLNSGPTLFWKQSETFKRRGDERWSLNIKSRIGPLWFVIDKRHWNPVNGSWNRKADSDYTDPVYTVRCKTTGCNIPNTDPSKARAAHIAATPALHGHEWENDLMFDTFDDARRAVEQVLIELGNTGCQIRSDREKWG